MQIVIDIPEIDYEYIKNDSSIPIAYDNHVYDAIRNGTTLPKGHGNLIDTDILHHEMSELLKSTTADETETAGLDNIAVSVMMEIEEAPVIIEADRED